MMKDSWHDVGVFIYLFRHDFDSGSFRPGGFFLAKKMRGNNITRATATTTTTTDYYHQQDNPKEVLVRRKGRKEIKGRNPSIPPPALPPGVRPFVHPHTEYPTPTLILVAPR